MDHIRTLRSPVSAGGRGSTKSASSCLQGTAAWLRQSPLEQATTENMRAPAVFEQPAWESSGAGPVGTEFCHRRLHGGRLPGPAAVPRFRDSRACCSFQSPGRGRYGRLNPWNQHSPRHPAAAPQPWAGEKPGAARSRRSGPCHWDRPPASSSSPTKTSPSSALAARCNRLPCSG